MNNLSLTYIYTFESNYEIEYLQNAFKYILQIHNKETKETKETT